MYSNKNIWNSANSIQKEYDYVIYLHFVETLRKTLSENYLLIFVFLVSDRNVP